MRLNLGVLACLAVFCFPALAIAQPAGSHPRIGLLAWDACEMPALITGLKDLGRKPGENIVIECRSAGKRSVSCAERWPVSARKASVNRGRLGKELMLPPPSLGGAADYRSRSGRALSGEGALSFLMEVAASCLF